MTLKSFFHRITHHLAHPLAIGFGFVLLASLALAQTSLLPIPSGVGTSGQVLAVTSDGNNVQGTSAISAATSVTVGGGTAITKIVVTGITFSPTSVAAATCAERTATLTGVTSADRIVFNQPVLSGAVAAVAARASGADTVAVTFCNPTAGALIPASGTYTFTAIRS